MKNQVMALVMAVLGLNLLLPPAANAHCDTMDGPVVQDARRALESGKADSALKWVEESQEGKIKKAFGAALRDRKDGGKAREAADRKFFEILVKAHREGEGESYSGLKPSGTPLEPGVKESDEALKIGSIAGLDKEIQKKMRRVLEAKYAAVVEKRRRKDASVRDGREYVKAYVDYVHYVAHLYEAIEGKAAPSDEE